jgi:hypothetical protein
MADKNIQGMSAVIVKNSRVIKMVSYGYADFNVKQRAIMTLF